MFKLLINNNLYAILPPNLTEKMQIRKMLVYVQFYQKRRENGDKKKFGGTPTTPHFFGSLGVREHEKHDERALSVDKLFCRPNQYLIFYAIFPFTLNLCHLAQERRR